MSPRRAVASRSLLLALKLILLEARHSMSVGQIIAVGCEQSGMSIFMAGGPLSNLTI